MSSTRQAASTERIVSAPLADLRRRPDHRSECVSECPMGSRLLVLEARDGGRWLRVLAPDGYRAWIRSWATVGRSHRVAARGLTVRAVAAAVRSRPERSAPVVCPVPMSARLGAGGVRGAWRAVLTPNGAKGWIERSAVEDDGVAESAGIWGPCSPRGPRPNPDSISRATVDRCVARAMAILGAPYRWGGVTPWGIDCSGLIRLILGLEGVGLPRDAGKQRESLAEWERPVSPAAIRAGDLVFFGARAGVIDHVGFGIGGRPGRFIHSSGWVRISGLNGRDPMFDSTLRGRVRAVIRLPFAPSQARAGKRSHAG